MTPQQQLAAFIADLRQISYFINIDRNWGTRTSVEALIQHLQATVGNPQQMTVLQAVQRCGNANDERIRKYLPAIQRLVSVWGHGADNYPAATGALATTASENFYRYRRLLPDADRFDYEGLLRSSTNAMAFGLRTAPQGYVHRIPNPHGAGNLDITSRGLVLRSGLVPEANGSGDRGYITRLQLTATDLDNMRNRSIADVGCGAAVFRAEMETLYGCATTGLDISHVQIALANAEVRRRYIRSILYLKMLVDTNRLNVVTLTAANHGPLITRLADNLVQTLTAYTNNLPIAGDIFNMPAAVIVHANQRWDYVVTMYLLCYFTAIQQTQAVINMCGAATRAVYIYNGSGNAVQTQNLIYSQPQVMVAFPHCRIVVKDAATHHIFLQ